MSDYPTIAAMAKELDQLLAENESLRIRIQELETIPRYTQSDNRPKLTDREAVTIRDLKREGATQAELADIFDVNPATISRIVRGQYHRSAA